MKTCTQKILILALAAATVFISTSAMAAAVHNVSKTSHNLRQGGGSIGAALDAEVVQVCIYCHTPHSAAKAGPLWNKAGANFITGQTFKLYTSSASLSSATKASSLPAGSPSLLCLSCHDGKTAMNILHNSSYGVDIAASIVANKSEYPVGSRVISAQNGDVNDAFLMPEPRWSGELNDGDGGYTKDMRTGMNDSLTDDHPIGFSYSAAYGEKPAKLNDIATMDSSIRFFGPEKRMECSTCHNPHVDSSGVNINYKPFLAKSNANSELCLACHNK